MQMDQETKDLAFQLNQLIAEADKVPNPLLACKKTKRTTRGNRSKSLKEHELLCPHCGNIQTSPIDLSEILTPFLQRCYRCGKDFQVHS